MLETNSNIELKLLGFGFWKKNIIFKHLKKIT